MNILDLKTACDRFNRTASQVGSDRRVDHDRHGPSSAWAWTVTETARDGRDHQTHGFHYQLDAVAHVTDLATALRSA